MNINPELSSNRIILYAANGVATPSPILFGGSEGEKLVLLTNATLTTNQPGPSTHFDHQLNAASSESDHYYCKSSDMDSSPFGKNDLSDSGYHPWQWAERAQTVQLASSPDRNGYNSRPNSPLLSLSPCRSSPILFSPPSRASVLTKRYDNFQENFNQSNTTPNSILASSNSAYNLSAKRGRPSQEEISTLIVSGSSSKSAIKCDVCNRVFPREKSLQAHLRTHTGERPYKCSYKDCLRAFAQSGQLRTHQRLHTGEKPFACRAVGCQNRFTHPNRKCNLHPNDGLRRILPALTPASTSATVAKKSVENKTTPKSTLRCTNNSLRNQSISKPVLGNITSSVVNSPKKTTTSLGSSSCVPTNSNRQAPIVARKSVIVGGRTSRKLELELDAVASLSPTSNKPKVITSIKSENSENNQQRPATVAQQQQTNSLEQSPERNRSDILGALALMELAGVFKNTTNSENQHRSPVKVKREDNSENRAPLVRHPFNSSPKKLRSILSATNN